MANTPDDLNQSYDAKELAKELETKKDDQPKIAKVDVEADYEASKSLSTSEADQGNRNSASGASSNPDAFRQMAKDIRSDSKKSK